MSHGEPFVKISRNPFDTHYQEGGCYVSNFDSWTIILDGQVLAKRELISACTITAEAEKLTWDAVGDVILGTDGMPVTETIKGEKLILQGRAPELDEVERESMDLRKTAEWWHL